MVVRRTKMKTSKKRELILRALEDAQIGKRVADESYFWDKSLARVGLRPEDIDGDEIVKIVRRAKWQLK